MKINKYRFIQAIFIFLFLWEFGLKSSAQISGSLFMLPNNFYAQMMNPSYLRNDDAKELAIPGLAGFSFGNSANFKISDLITINETGNPVIDFENFYATGNTNNFIRENLIIPLLFFSTPVRKGRLSFYYRENFNAFSKLKMNAVEFLVNGNTNPEYRNYSSDEIKMFGVGYRDFTFGYARDMNKKLDVGAHFKILFGSAFIEVENWEYGIETSETGQNVILTSRGNGNMSIPLPIVITENQRILNVNSDGAVGKYFGSYKNPGVAFDFGATYKIDELNTFSVSMLDLGGIWFRNNTVDLLQQENLDFVGFDITNAVRYPGEGYIDPLELMRSTKEEIRNVFRPIADSSKMIKTLSPKTILNYHYKLSDFLWLGVTNQSTFRKNYVWNVLSLSAMQNGANLSVFENINLHGTSSLTFGGGVQYEGTYGQIFLAANNLPAFYHPANNKSFSLMFGICFLLNHEKNVKWDKMNKNGRRKSKGKASEFLPFYLEK